MTETSQDGLAGLDASGDSEEYCKACENPAIIPIFPVRIAWADLEGDVNDGFTYPTSLTALRAPSDAAAGKGFCLRTLRKGDVFIYDETNAQWSFFAHEPGAGIGGGTYTRWDLTEEDAGLEDWGPPTDTHLALPYVADNCETVLIAFTAHRWKTFSHIAGNTNGSRDALMTRVQLSAPSAATFSAPLAELGDYVAEFGGDTFVHARNTWNTLSDVGMQALDPAKLLSSTSVMRANGAAVMIGLHDAVGVALEMATSHVNRVSIRSQFLEANAYPLASARAVQVLQDTATSQLASRGLDSAARRMFTEWGTSVRPEYATFLQQAEADLEGFDDTLTGSLAAWEKFFGLGASDPAGTKGSLQNSLLAFPEKLEDEEEIRGLIELAQASVASLSASKAGTARVRAVALSQDNWETSSNPVTAAIKIVGGSLVGAGQLNNLHLATRNAASTLLADLAMPAALEIEQLRRIDMLTEVNQFTNGIYRKTVRKVMEPISNATQEVMGPRPRQSQSTIIRRGHMINRVQVPVGVYKFDGVIHVSGVHVKSALAQGANGFGIFANALNIVSLTSGVERDRIQGLFSAATDPRLALALTAIQTATQLMEAGYDAATNGQTVRRYFVRGQLNRATLAKLMQGKGLSDDLARSVTSNSGLRQVRASALSTSRVMSWVGRVATFAGFAFGAIDLMNATQAWRRGDNVAALSNLSMGLGAILLTAGGAAMLAGFTGVGAVIGIVLIILGVVLSFFIDDPVTQWLKGSYWGTARNYTFWDDRSRANTIQRDANESSPHLAQRKLASRPLQGYDIARYFQREMQEFHEIVYWPQDARDPAAIYAVKEVGIWPFNRTTRVMAHTGMTQQFSFRLPNFIDGLSEFDGRFFVLWRGRRLSAREGLTMREHDITEQVRQNLIVENGAQGILRSSYRIEMLANQNQNVLDDVEWETLGVYLVRGWSYAPNQDIQLPMTYNDHWFSGAWDADAEIGGRTAIRVG